MRNRNILVIAVVFGVLAIGAFLSGPAMGQEAMEKSLYERLGGYDAISAVVDDFAQNQPSPMASSRAGR